MVYIELHFKNNQLRSLAFTNPGSKNSFEAVGKRKIKYRSQFDFQSTKYVRKPDLNLIHFNVFDILVSRQIYDDKGLLIDSGKDICDCLRKNCPGCHFPCKHCKSTKCGNKCRCNRTWYYEKIEIEGLSKQLEMPMEE